MILPAFDSTSYFFNFIALSFVLLPLYILIKSTIFRRYLLIFVGVYLLYFIAPRLALFYIVFWVILAIFQRVVVLTAEHTMGKFVFWLVLLFTLSPMIIWKLNSTEFNVAFNLLSNDILALVSQRLWELDLAKDIVIPIGLSFASFRAADLLIKSYIGRIAALPLDRVIFYGLFPAVQITGPIMEYEEIQEIPGTGLETPLPQDVAYGLIRICIGLLKVIVVTGALKDSAEVFNRFYVLGPGVIWLNLIAYSWFFYLNFSGYSDLAIGLARIYGFRLKENFNFPYFKSNLTNFWNSWHMSLSRFAQRNAFIPLGGYRKKSQYLAIFLTMMLIALWHDLSWGMMVFGIYHGIGIIINRVSTNSPNSKLVLNLNIFFPLNMVITYLFVLISFPLLVLDLGTAVSFYFALFGLS